MNLTISNGGHCGKRHVERVKPHPILNVMEAGGPDENQRHKNGDSQTNAAHNCHVLDRRPSFGEKILTSISNGKCRYYCGRLGKSLESESRTAKGKRREPNQALFVGLCWVSSPYPPPAPGSENPLFPALLAVRSSYVEIRALCGLRLFSWENCGERKIILPSSIVITGWILPTSSTGMVM